MLLMLLQPAYDLVLLAFVLFELTRLLSGCQNLQLTSFGLSFAGASI
jgi:hypothetical protein